VGPRDHGEAGAVLGGMQIRWMRRSGRRRMMTDLAVVVALSMHAAVLPPAGAVLSPVFSYLEYLFLTFDLTVV